MAHGLTLQSTFMPGPARATLTPSQGVLTASALALQLPGPGRRLRHWCNDLTLAIHLGTHRSLPTPLINSGALIGLTFDASLMFSRSFINKTPPG
jgi:hypothetical protein